jgi:hypothetical protein
MIETPRTVEEYEADTVGVVALSKQTANSAVTVLRGDLKRPFRPIADTWPGKLRPPERAKVPPTAAITIAITATIKRQSINFTSPFTIDTKGRCGGE